MLQRSSCLPYSQQLLGTALWRASSLLQTSDIRGLGLFEESLLNHLILKVCLIGQAN